MSREQDQEANFARQEDQVSSKLENDLSISINASLILEDISSATGLIYNDVKPLAARRCWVANWISCRTLVLVDLLSLLTHEWGYEASVIDLSVHAYQDQRSPFLLHQSLLWINCYAFQAVESAAEPVATF